MVNKIRYEFEDNYITIIERGDWLYLYEYNNDSELDFRIEDSEKVITLLENLKTYIDNSGINYVDLGTYGNSTGEYYWNDEFQ